MRCTIISRAGQVLAYGRLFISHEENGGLQLNVETDRGRLLQGGFLSEDGDMAEAGQILSEQFFDVWGSLSAKLCVAWPTRLLQYG